ncbi:MAG: hypothetical protein Q9181_002375 [Wetmoreana brouardii]
MTDDVNTKMRASGWHVLEIPDGNYNVAAILRALEHAQDYVVIGLGTSVEGTHFAHEDPFGAEDVARAKRIWGLNPAESHQIGEDVRQYWSEVPKQGSADLLAYSGITKSGVECFGSRDTETSKANFAASYVHYGVREHGMMAIANGIAAYSKRAFLPVTSTFSAFQLYGAAALRMSALCGLKVVHIGTHDSIEEGMCGPSHRAVEVMSFYRAMPNLLHIRPADAEEVIGAWMMAIEYQGPTALGLNSEKVPLLAGTDRLRMQKGAYILSEDRDYRVTLVATGSDVWRVVEAAKMLQADRTPCRTVSVRRTRRGVHSVNFPSRRSPCGVGAFRHDNTVPPSEEDVLPLFSCRGKTAIVSRAGTGIGLAVARALAEAGANVAIWYNTTKQASERAREIETAYNLKVRAYQVDVTNEQMVQNAVEETIEDFHGRLDIFVANAGITGAQGSMLDVDTENYHKVIATDLDSTLYCAKAAAKHWKRQQTEGTDTHGNTLENFTSGSFVATSSISGSIVDVPELQAAYCTAKA